MSNGMIFKVVRKKRDRFTGIATAFSTDIPKLVENALTVIEADAKQWVKKRSGVTKALIYQQIELATQDIAVGKVVSGARWSHMLEFGRKTYKATPFMRPAAAAGRNYIKKRLKKEIREILKGAK